MRRKHIKLGSKLGIFSVLALCGSATWLLADSRFPSAVAPTYQGELVQATVQSEPGQPLTADTKTADTRTSGYAVPSSLETVATAMPSAPMQMAQRSGGRTGLIEATTGSSFIANAVERVGPAVVRINASRTVETQVPPVFRDPFFRRFFGEVPDMPSTRVERGTGSGFIIDRSGLILTNAHVVEGASDVTVTLKDGREIRGQVMGRDPVTDVAVVRIEANNLPTVTFGNSDRIRPGESDFSR